MVLGVIRAHDPHGVTDDRTIVGNRAVDHAVAANKNVVPYGDFPKQHRPRADVNVVANMGHLPVREVSADGYVLADPAILTDYRVVVDHNAQAPVANN